MAEIRALPTLTVAVNESVWAEFDKLRAHVESGQVSGMSVAVTFRDGRSLTFSSRTENRREMLGLLLDALLDFQGNSSA